MYVYNIYIYIYVYVYVYIYIYISDSTINMHTHDHGRTDARTHARARTHTHTHLSEEPLEDIGRKDVPCDRVGDGREDPVEFAHDCLAVVELPGYLFQQRLVHLCECASMRVSMPFVCARVLACVLLQQLLLHRPALCLLCACLHVTGAWVVGYLHTIVYIHVYICVCIQVYTGQDLLARPTWTRAQAFRVFGVQGFGCMPPTWTENRARSLFVCIDIYVHIPGRGPRGVWRTTARPCEWESSSTT